MYYSIQSSLIPRRMTFESESYLTEAIVSTARESRVSLSLPLSFHVRICTCLLNADLTMWRLSRGILRTHTHARARVAREEHNGGPLLLCSGREWRILFREISPAALLWDCIRKEMIKLWFPREESSGCLRCDWKSCFCGANVVRLLIK